MKRGIARIVRVLVQLLALAALVAAYALVLTHGALSLRHL